MSSVSPPGTVVSSNDEWNVSSRVVGRSEAETVEL